jgi:hypothetical protein
MAMPPITPPTIAPTGAARGPDAVVVGRPDDVEVEDGTLFEVPTTEPDPSVRVGAMRK